MRARNVHYWASALLVSTAMLNPCASSAQIMDYGSLQSLFNEPVTTSATGVPQRESDVPANMSIITADDIRRAGTRNIPQIIGMYVPGIDVLQESITQFSVGVRGNQQPEQPNLLVLLDGRQVFFDDYSRTVWSNLPVNIDDIRQIEVVKGASSALFGSNAAYGVINIVTYSPLYDKNNVANATAGTQSNYTGDATVTKNGDWGGTKFSAGGLTSNEFHNASTRNVGSDQNPPFVPHHEYATNSSIFELTPTIKANTELTYSRSSENILDPLDLVAAGQDTTTYSIRAGLDWQGPYGLITFNNYFNHTIADVLTDGLIIPVEFHTNMYVSQLQDQFRMGSDNIFRAAIEFRRKGFYAGGGDIILPQDPKLGEDIYTVSGSWTHKFTEKLSWTNAVRIDRQEMNQDGTLNPADFNTYADYSHINNAWSANSDIVYKPTDIDSFRLGWGRGIQLPSLVESGYMKLYNYAGVPIDTEGNPHLNPAATQDVSADYERKIDTIDSKAKLSVFYQSERDIITTIPAGLDSLSLPAFTFTNVGGSHSWGGEASLKGSNSQGFRWGGSYSLQKVVDDPNTLIAIDYQNSAPQHHIRLNGGYTTGPWEFDGFAQYVSSTSMQHSPDAGFTVLTPYINAYTSINGRIGYNITDNLTLALSGIMLNHSDIMTSPYPAVQRQVFLGLTGKF